MSETRIVTDKPHIFIDDLTSQFEKLITNEITHIAIFACCEECGAVYEVKHDPRLRNLCPEHMDAILNPKLVSEVTHKYKFGKNTITERYTVWSDGAHGAQVYVKDNRGHRRSAKRKGWRRYR